MWRISGLKIKPHDTGMVDFIPPALVGLLAIAGGFALVARLLRSLGVYLLRTAELVAASGAAEAHARRGDLTGLGDARSAERRARRSRRRGGFTASFWLVWIVVPLGIGTPALYALAAPLWFLPGGIAPPRRQVR